MEIDYFDHSQEPRRPVAEMSGRIAMMNIFDAVAHRKKEKEGAVENGAAGRPEDREIFDATPIDLTQLAVASKVARIIDLPVKGEIVSGSSPQNALEDFLASVCLRSPRIWGFFEKHRIDPANGQAAQEIAGIIEKRLNNASLETLDKMLQFLTDFAPEARGGLDCLLNFPGLRKKLINRLLREDMEGEMCERLFVLAIGFTNCSLGRLLEAKRTPDPKAYLRSVLQNCAD